MVADVVEDSQVKTGRRSEGLFFAASAFVNKLVSAAGLFFAGLMLSLVGFPAAAQPGHIDHQVLTRLVLVYLPTYTGLYLVAIGFLTRYGISRRSHEDNLRRLGQAVATAEAAEEIAGVPRAPGAGLAGFAPPGAPLGRAFQPRAMFYRL